jgi:hypothetical protein
MDHVIVGIAAVFFAGMGLYGLAAPQALVAPFRIDLAAGAARTEVRAVYGGFGIGIAALLGVAAVDPGAHGGVLLAVAVALYGMAGGRLVGRVFDRPDAFYPVWFYFWVEVVAATALLIAQ